MCLNEKIGVRGCIFYNEDATHFLNDLPGLSLEKLVAIKDKNQEFETFFDNLKNRAFDNAKRIVQSSLRKRFKLRKIQEVIETTKELRTTTTAPAAEQRGLYIGLGESAFSKININAFFFYSTASISKTFRIFDFETNTEIENISVTLVSGWNEIKVGKSYNSNKIGILVDCSDLTTTDLKIIHLGCFCETICNGCELVISGAKIPDGGALQKSSNTNGFAVSVTTVCDYSKLLCVYNEEILPLYNWLCGVEVMKEILVSDRLNRFTTIDKNSANVWLEIYEKKVIEDLENLVKDLDLANDCCVDCAPKYSIQNQLP